jgi:hypothetical protein
MPVAFLLANRSALQVAKHPENQSTMKHVHRAYHWLRNHVDRNLIVVSHVPGHLSAVHIFAKSLSMVKLICFCDMLGLRS